MPDYGLGAQDDPSRIDHIFWPMDEGSYYSRYSLWFVLLDIVLCIWEKDSPMILED
jgi:hypothetical protein